MPVAERSKAARTAVKRRRPIRAATGQAERRKPASGPVWTSPNSADQSAQKVGEFGASSAMGRPVQPEQLAPSHVFLAAPSCASCLSGAVLPLTSGPTG